MADIDPNELALPPEPELTAEEETAEILADPQTMTAIAEGLGDLK